MSKNKSVVFAVAMFAFGSANADDFTLKEAAQLQNDIARAEMQAKLQEAKAKIQSLGSTIQTQTVEDKKATDILTLLSIYGIGNQLQADFMYKNAVITLSEKSSGSFAGWRVEKLTTSYAVLVKQVSGVITQRETLYISGASTGDIEKQK